MPHDWDSPLRAIGSAIVSTIGWAVVVPCLVYSGLVLGCLCTDQRECLSRAFYYMAVLPVAWLFCPIILPAYLVAFFSYWWPLRSDSEGAFFKAAVMTVVAWTLAGWALNR